MTDEVTGTPKEVPEPVDPNNPPKESDIQPLADENPDNPLESDPDAED
jgi:hypothetical protein